MPGLESDRREGDSVEARTPKGIGRIEILKILY
jgi:transcription elongation GreA/GreB family factor